MAQSVAESERTLNKPRDLDVTLQTIVEVARNSIWGFDHVGIATLEKKSDIETRAFVGDLVRPLDKVQYGLRERPFSSALQGTDEVSRSSLRHDQRWPGYVLHARQAGVRSQMAVKLYLGDNTLGGINFYSTTSDEVSDGGAHALARLFATHAAIALGHAQERDTLNEGLQTRRAIGQATGLLMQ